MPYEKIYHSLRHPLQSETTLYVVRHGRTESNVQQLLCGRTDSPLDSFGIRQAHLIAERMSQDLTIDTLLASPLSRALTTARFIGERIGLEPEIVPGLTEMDFGVLEGATIAILQQNHPELALRLASSDGEDLTWPEGESLKGFHARVMATFQTILADHPSQSVAVVTHGGVIGSLIAQIEGVSPNEPGRYTLANCGLTQLVVTPEYTEIQTLNDVLHLEHLNDKDEGV
jgi:broad specificity phosphatase PhoE